MSSQPRTLGSATVRRYLEQAGPTVAQMVAAVSSDESAPVSPLAPLIAQVEQTKAWALEAGAREAAWLLYEGARACLLENEEYVRATEWVRGKPKHLRSLEARAATLGARLNGAGRSVVAWPETRFAKPKRQLAQECLDLAEAIEPRLSWITLQRGLVKMSAGDWSAAVKVLVALLGEQPKSDVELKRHAIRNLLSSLVESGSAASVEPRLNEYLDIEPTEPAGGYFEMELRAARRDLAGFQQARDRFLSRLAGHSAAAEVTYWRRTIKMRINAWTRSLDQTEQSILATLSDLDL